MLGKDKENDIKRRKLSLGRKGASGSAAAALAPHAPGDNSPCPRPRGPTGTPAPPGFVDMRMIQHYAAAMTYARPDGSALPLCTSLVPFSLFCAARALDIGADLPGPGLTVPAGVRGWIDSMVEPPPPPGAVLGAGCWMQGGGPDARASSCSTPVEGNCGRPLLLDARSPMPHQHQQQQQPQQPPQLQPQPQPPPAGARAGESFTVDDKFASDRSFTAAATDA